MPGKKQPRIWADPNREGRSKTKGNRFCSRCGNTVQQTRILKSANLCEFCINELTGKKDGIFSCKGCGKVAPLELREHKGYCSACLCSACGRPDPEYVRKTGLCFPCASSLGDFCRKCGKEAAAQVRKNRGYCDECVRKPVAKPEINGGRKHVPYKEMNESRRFPKAGGGNTATFKRKVIDGISQTVDGQKTVKTKRNQPVSDSKRRTAGKAEAPHRSNPIKTNRFR